MLVYSQNITRHKNPNDDHPDLQGRENLKSFKHPCYQGENHSANSTVSNSCGKNIMGAY